LLTAGAGASSGYASVCLYANSTAQDVWWLENSKVARSCQTWQLGPMSM
jgi:hypothetical protein